MTPLLLIEPRVSTFPTLGCCSPLISCVLRPAAQAKGPGGPGAPPPWWAWAEGLQEAMSHSWEGMEVGWASGWAALSLHCWIIATPPPLFS